MKKRQRRTNKQLKELLTPIDDLNCYIDYDLAVEYRNKRYPKEVFNKKMLGELIGKSDRSILDHQKGNHTAVFTPLIKIRDYCGIPLNELIKIKEK